MFRSLGSELAADLRSEKLPAALAIGLLTALRRVVSALSFAAIIFSGPLAAYAVQGAGPLLFGACALSLTTGLLGGFRGATPLPTGAPAAVLFTIGVSVAPRFTGSLDAAFVTMVAIMGLSSVATAACFLLIARFRLANLFRFIPYPVTAGFLAGLGWSIVAGGVAAMCGIVPGWQTLPELFQPEVVLRWTPGVVLAVILFVVTKRWSHFLIYPSLVVLATALCHLVLRSLGMTVAEAGEAGVLFSGVPDGTLWPPFPPAELALVDWGVVMSQIPGIAGIVLIMLVYLVVVVGAVEASTGVEMDLHREFRAAGLGCLVAGLGGSSPGSQTPGWTLVTHLAGANTRLTGIVTGIGVAAIIVAGGAILNLFPIALIGGLVVFVGIRLLSDWLLRAPRRLPRADFAIVVLIAAIVGAIGFLEGLAVGLVVTLIVFAVRFSGVEVVGDEFTAAHRVSQRNRPASHRAILRSEGRRIRAYRLRGYLFFGSASSLGDRLRNALRADPPPKCLLLDFAAVTGVDVSATHSFARIVRLAGSAGTRIVFSASSERLRSSMRRNLPEASFRYLSFEKDLDHGLERCEEILIGEWTEVHSSVEERREALFGLSFDEALSQVERQAAFETLVDQLEPWLETRTYALGETLMLRGEKQEGLQFLISGRAVARLREGGPRLREYGAGDAIAPQAAFEDHMAERSVVAEAPCRVALMTAAARRSLEEQNLALALAMDKHLIGAILSRPGAVPGDAPS